MVRHSVEVIRIVSNLNCYMENARTPKYIFNVRFVLWALKDVFRV
jgi:hypothetical protein